MKVVIFCGGFGLRMRSGVDSAPKPMMTIGDRPVLWHIMRYYAHFGHREFILCLGYGAGSVKDYFLNYRETESNDFMLRGGGRVQLLSTDISGWQITFVDTGIDTAIGERLRRVRHHIKGEELFLANYGDVLTDAPMDELVDEFLATDAVGQLLAVKPQDSFHVVRLGGDGDLVTGFQPAGDMNLRINGGFFVLRTDIFDYLYEGEDLVMDGCRRAADAGRLRAVSYDGFWAPMDTLKERAYLEDLYGSGRAPWAVWRDCVPSRRLSPIEVPDIAAVPSAFAS